MQRLSSKYMYDIASLVYVAETNFLVCEKIYREVIDINKKHPAYDFLLLSANNAFNEAVSILHTLLCSSRKEELLIKPALEQILQDEKNVNPNVDINISNQFIEKLKESGASADFLSHDFDFLGSNYTRGDLMMSIRINKRKTAIKDLQDLRSKFEGYSFHKVRHQLSAHKNKALLVPAGSVRLELRKDFILNLGETIRELKINNNLWFDYSLINPYEDTLISLNKIINP